jgi:hypothetical protein
MANASVGVPVRCRRRPHPAWRMLTKFMVAGCVCSGLLLITHNIGRGSLGPFVPLLAGAAFVIVLLKVATFTACAGVPVNPDSCRGEATQAQTNNENLKTKQKRLDELKAELEDAKARGVLTAAGEWLWSKVPYVGGAPPETPAEIQPKIDTLSGDIAGEMRAQAAAAGELAGKMLRLLDSAKETSDKGHKAEHPDPPKRRLELKTLLPGLPESTSGIIGLGRFVSDLDALIRGVEPVIRQRCQQLEAFSSEALTVVDRFARAQELLPSIASESTPLEEVAAAFGALDRASDDLGTLLLKAAIVELFAGYLEIDRLATFLDPRPPISAIVGMDAGYAGPPVHFQGEIELDAHLLTALRPGNIVAVSLPRGYSLTAPIEVNPSPTMQISTTGNEAGSGAIAISVLESTETRGDFIALVIDQPIQVRPEAIGTSELRIWNLHEAHGLAIPVVTVQAQRGVG